MKYPQILFTTNAPFKTLQYDDAACWIFIFAEDIYASSQGFWRLLQNKEIVVVSLDNGHPFGLPEPIDLVDEVNKHLHGHSLLQIEVAEGTGDLTLEISGGYTIQIFISSIGYETTEFAINRMRYIGMGGGEYAMMAQFS